MVEEYQEIEKMSDLKKAAEESTENPKQNVGKGKLTFDNKGNIVSENRAYNRDYKRVWRAVTEGKKSIRFYTKKKNKTSKATKKAERQNKKKGRR